MDARTFGFLRSVLGADGAQALKKAVQRDQRLAVYLVPRTVLAWVVETPQYDGALPGAKDVYVSFTKNEAGVQSAMAVGDAPVLEMQSTDHWPLVAQISLALGYRAPDELSTTARSLRSVGASVDSLVKSQKDIAQIRKAAIELPGQTAKPRGAQEPAKPEAPKKQPKLPRIGGMLKVEVSAQNKKCSACGAALFKNSSFVGCVCLGSLAKHTSTVIYSDGAVLEFGRSADPRAIRTLSRELYG